MIFSIISLDDIFADLSSDRRALEEKKGAECSAFFSTNPADYLKAVSRQ